MFLLVIGVAAEAERDEDALSSLVGGASAMDANFQLVDTSRVQRPIYQKMKMKQQQVRYLSTRLVRGLVLAERLICQVLHVMHM